MAKRGRPAKKRKGGPSYEEVKADIDKKESEKPVTKKQQREEEKRKLRLSTPLDEINDIKNNTPKLNGDKNLKGPKSDLSESIRKIHGTLSKLSGSVRKAVVRIGKLEKQSETQEEKTTKIVNILKTKQSNIGKKLPGSSADDLNKSLAETNKVLVDILKQMQLESALEDKERRKLKEKTQREKSRKRLSSRESELEKSSKKLSKETKKKSESMMSPIKGILDDLLEFILLIGVRS